MLTGPELTTQNAQQSPFRIFIRFLRDFLEAIAALYALPGELITRRQMGRRYFSLLGLVGVYVVYALTFGIALLVLDFDSWRPTLQLNLTGSPPPQVAAVERAQAVAGFWILMRALLVLGVVHKLAMQYRKVCRKEPRVSTYGGQCWLEPLLFRPVAYLGFDRMARTAEDAVKRWLEPFCLFMVSFYVVVPFVNRGIGYTLALSAVAMAVRAYLIHLRNQDAIDDVSDLTAIWEQRLSFVGSQEAQHGNQAMEAVPVTTP